MDKYYTPTVEEFHQGFDYEIEITKWTNGGKEKEWQQLTYNISYNLPYGTTCRVKYLDKEDIESLGWKGNGNSYLHSEGKFRLVIESFDNYQTILIETLGGLKYYGYLESIKNKSELKKLMKQLGICN